MLIEIGRNAWENFLSTLNSRYQGEKVRMRLLKRGHKGETLATSELFGLEPYLNSGIRPSIAVVLGSGNVVNLGYFLKKPSKLVVEETPEQEIKRVYIGMEDRSTAVLEFTQTHSESFGPTEVTYHHNIRPKKR